MQAEPDLTDTLQAITEAAVANIPGAAHAGITLVTGGGRRVSTPASTDELVERLDRIRNDTQQGPCLDAIREQATVRSDDLTREQRWPLCASHAAIALIGAQQQQGLQVAMDSRDLIGQPKAC